MTTQEAQQIAMTILGQLGGSRFIAMTGARDLMSVTDPRPGLRFRLPRAFAKDGIVHVRVELDPSDTYRVQFLTRTGAQVAEFYNVYCDQLRKVFTGATGLETSLGTMGR